MITLLDGLVFERLDLWWLLLAPLLLAAAFVLEAWLARRALAKIGSPELVLRLLRRASGARRFWRRALCVAALALVAVAALRPRAGFKAQRVQHVGIDVAVLVDVSRSMLVPDVPPNRLKAATSEISALLDRLQGGRVGLVPFAGVPFVQCPLTSDHEVIRQYLADLRVADMPVPGTDLGRALRLALDVLGLEPEVTSSDPAGEGEEQGRRAVEKVRRYQGSRHKAVVVLTDGEDFGEGLEEALEEVSGAGVPVYIVGVGTPAGKPVPTLDEEGAQTGVQKDEEGKPVFSALGEDVLERVAAATEGSRFMLGQGSVVGPLYAQLDRLEKQEYEDQVRKLREDRYAIPLALALLLLLLEPWLSEKRRRPKVRAKGATAALLAVGLAAGLAGCDFDESPYVVESSAVNKALEAIADDRASEAVGYIEEAREDLPDRPELDLDEGLALLAAAEPKEAQKKLERSLERIGTEYRTKVLYALGLAHAREALGHEELARAIAAGVKAAAGAKKGQGQGQGQEEEQGQMRQRVEDVAALSLSEWRRARDLFEEVLRRQTEHEGARRGLEVALYRTDPPCRYKDLQGEPDDPPRPPRALELDQASHQAKIESLLCPDDTDQYGLAVPRGARMFVSVEGSSDQGKAVLKARGIPHIDEDPDRTRIDGLAAPEDLDVVFEVRHRDPLEGEVAYKLDALVLPDCHVLDGEDPPDDRPGAAKRADHLVEAPMRLCPGDLDHVAVELTEGLSLLVLADVTDPQQGQGQPQAQGGAPPQPGKGPRVPGQPKDVAPDVVVTDLKGEVLVRGVGGGGRILAVLPEPEPGGYVVSVRAPKSHPRLETPYRLTVIRVPPCPEGDIDDFAAAQQGAPENDGPDQATQIRPGSMTVGRVCPGDEDWYAFEADEKEETQVEVSFDRSRAKLMVDGYLGDDVSGPAKEAASVPSGAVFTVPKLEEAEAPKVRVKGEGEEDQGIYLLRHVAQPPRQQQDQQDQQQNQDQQDQQDQEDQEQGQDKGQNQQQEQPSALDQLLQDMDQNPKNLEAEEAAKKLQGTIVVPLRDW